ncbi:mCG146857 [Mus musculus]|jgi:hypothetical protein|nr:mCG146857 [Mus musculus]
MTRPYLNEIFSKAKQILLKPCNFSKELSVYYVDQADLGLTEIIPTSASQVLELRTCATTAGNPPIFLSIDATRFCFCSS